jgi:hypothetical protein
MTLHEAIEKLLRQSNRAMSTQEIAEELNKNGWYQKKDGSEIQAFQIYGRTRNYPSIFDRDGSTVFLVGQDNKKVAISKLKPTKQPKKVVQNSICDVNSLEKTLMKEANFKSINEIDFFVPDASGIYCIRITDVNKLPSPFNSILKERNHNIIYIGIASQSLSKRFLNQELRAKGHGTFFRSIGAVLGYLPPKGSLVEKKNKRNYRFSPEYEQKIIHWINTNIVVNYVVYSNNLNNTETILINKYKPLLNLTKNPAALEILSRLRKECVNIANTI